MQDGEPQVYSALATLHNGLTLRQWQRLQSIFLFNSVSMPFMFTTGQLQELKPALAAISLVIHVGLVGAAIETAKKVRYLERKLSALETLDEQSTEEALRIEIFSDVQYKPEGSWGIFASLGVGTTFWISMLILIYLNM